VCAILAVLAGRAILKRHAPPVFTESGEYSLVFVDHLGRRLSEKDGGLKLALDPYALYRNAPSQETKLFHIDRHGFRGGFDETDPRPRVLCLGGSAAFGFGLPSDTDVFTARLAALEPRWQVVNAAVVGYLSGQELAELVHRGDAVAPVAVVALDGWNDLYVPLLAATRFPAGGLSFGHNWDVFHLVEERLRLYTLAGAPESRTTGGDVPFDELLKQVTSTYAENLERLSRAAASRGARFLVVFQPWVASRAAPPEGERQALDAFRKIGARADPALYGTFIRTARTFLEKRGIPFLDLHADGPFRDASGALFQDSVHPNAEGHRLEASEIHRRLEELLPPTR
jgi:lysophospholipase L1-like esterase